MSGPKRIRLSRARGWKLPEGAVVVTRGPGRPWGNPFIVGKHGPAEKCVRLFAYLCSGNFTIKPDKQLLEAQEKFRDHFNNHIDELRGKDLACWCALDAPCHADVLIACANEPQPIDLNRFINIAGK